MSDLAQLQPDPAAPSVTTPSEATPRGSLARRIIAWVLVVIFAILTPLTLVSAWAVKTVTNTDRYVETLQPLAQDPVITNYVSDRATTKLFEEVGVEKRIANAIPVAGSLVAAPITQQLQTFTDTQLRKLTSSTWFANLWEKENRYTHDAAVAILTGKEPPPGTRARSLIVNLTPTITKAIDQLDARGITVFNPIKRRLQTNGALTLQLISPAQIKTASTYFNLAIELRWILLIGTPLIGIAAILVGVDRRRTAMRVMLGGILGGLLLVALLTFGRAFFVNRAPLGASMVAQNIFDTIFRFLHRTIYWTLGVFALIAAILWIVGPSTWAVALRRFARTGGRQLGDAAGQARHSDAAAKAVEHLEAGAAWIARSINPVRWFGVAVAAIFILIDRTASGMLWTLILLAIYEIAVSALAAWSTRRQRESASLEESSAKQDVSS